MARCKNTGFSLIEIMISLSIGLLVLSLLLALYVSGQRSVKLQTALYTIKDNAITAISLLEQEIHQAGHIGCAKLTANFPIESHGLATLNAANRITGNESELTVRYAQYPNAVLLEPMQDTETLVTDDVVGFESGDIVIVANCQQADIFTVDTSEVVMGRQILHSRQGLSHLYEAFSEVSLLVIHRFFYTKNRASAS